MMIAGVVDRGGWRLVKKAFLLRVGVGKSRSWEGRESERCCAFFEEEFFFVEETKKGFSVYTRFFPFTPGTCPAFLMLLFQLLR